MIFIDIAVCLFGFGIIAYGMLRSHSGKEILLGALIIVLVVIAHTLG